MSHYTVSVNTRHYEISMEASATTVNGEGFQPEVAVLGPGKLHVVWKRRSYSAEVLESHPAEKAFRIRVNRNTYTLQVRDRYDALLRELGMDAGSHRHINEVKAPMPGLVLRVMIEPGQAIRKGDTLLILEAMKMENVLKAPSDGVVSKILVSKGDKVKKNQVMVNMG